MDIYGITDPRFHKHQCLLKCTPRTGARFWSVYFTNLRIGKTLACICANIRNIRLRQAKRYILKSIQLLHVTHALHTLQIMQQYCTSHFDYSYAVGIQLANGSPADFGTDTAN